MQLIYVNRPGTPIAPLRQLTPGETEALHRVVLGEASQQAEALVRAARQQRWWFACTCRGPAANPPLLYVHRSRSGELSLSCMTDRPPHARGCPFGMTADAVGSCRDDDLGTLPSLGTLFDRWFMAAKLNVVYPYGAHDLLSRQFASLREVSRSLCIAPGRTLYDFSRTHPDALPSLVIQLQQAGGDRSPCDMEAGGGWGVLLAVVDSLADGRIVVGSEVVQLTTNELDTPMEEPGIGGPYAVLLKYTRDARMRGVFAQPIYSPHRLVPIAAAQERRTLKTLLSLQRKLLVEKEVVVVIRKTLPTTQAYDRGIAFRLHRLGPSGKPVNEIEVLSVDATQAPPVALNTSCPKDVVYHLVKRRAALHDLDRRFYNIVFARLLEGIGPESCMPKGKPDNQARMN